MYSANFDVAGACLSVRSSDPLLFDQLSRVLPRSAAERAGWTFEVTAIDDRTGGVRLDDLSGHEDLAAGLGTADFPFEEVDGENGELALAFLGEGEPVLWTRGHEVHFRLDPRWHTVISLLIYHKALRLQREVIFFHAATVSVEGSGAMIVGPKGAGKSTTALALIGRGHTLLSDETGAWRPSDGMLLPFLRHVGIKPGPRAESVRKRLVELGLDPDVDGILRLPVDELMPFSGSRDATPLRVIVLLKPFAEEPATLWRDAHRDDLSMLQPMSGSVVNESAARRTFQLSRMLSSVRICELHPGAPDDTAELLEKEIVDQWESP